MMLFWAAQSFTMTINPCYAGSQGPAKYIQQHLVSPTGLGLS